MAVQVDNQIHNLRRALDLAIADKIPNPRDELIAIARRSGFTVCEESQHITITDAKYHCGFSMEIPLSKISHGHLRMVLRTLIDHQDVHDAAAQDATVTCKLEQFSVIEPLLAHTAYYYNIICNACGYKACDVKHWNNHVAWHRQCPPGFTCGFTDLYICSKCHVCCVPELCASHTAFHETYGNRFVSNFDTWVLANGRKFVGCMACGARILLDECSAHCEMHKYLDAMRPFSARQMLHFGSLFRMCYCCLDRYYVDKEEEHMRVHDHLAQKKMILVPPLAPGVHHFDIEVFCLQCHEVMFLGQHEQHKCEK